MEMLRATRARHGITSAVAKADAETLAQLSAANAATIALEHAGVISP
jgi:hypothetical protein